MCFTDLLSTMEREEQVQLVEALEADFGVSAVYDEAELVSIISGFLSLWWRNGKNDGDSVFVAGDHYGFPATVIDGLPLTNCNVYGLGHHPINTPEAAIRMALPFFKNVYQGDFFSFCQRLVEQKASIVNSVSGLFAYSFFFQSWFDDEDPEPQKRVVNGGLGFQPFALASVSSDMLATFNETVLETMFRTTLGPIVTVTLDEDPLELLTQNLFVDGYVKQNWIHIFSSALSIGYVNAYFPSGHNSLGRYVGNSRILAALSNYAEQGRLPEVFGQLALVNTERPVEAAIDEFRGTLVNTDFCTRLFEKAYNCTQLSSSTFVRDDEKQELEAAEVANVLKAYTEKLRFPKVPKMFGVESSVRVYLSGNATSLELACDKLAYPLVINWIKKLHGTVAMPQGLGRNEFSLSLRFIHLVNHPGFLDEFKEALGDMGINVIVDYQVERMLRKKVNEHRRISAKFEQWMRETTVNPDGTEEVTWLELHADDGVRSSNPELYEEYIRRLKDNFPDPDGTTWAYLYDDAARLAMTGFGHAAHKMALGKTRLALMLCFLFNGDRNLIICERRNVDEWMRECDKLGIDDQVCVIDTVEDLDTLNFINIVPYTKLWREVDPRYVRYIVTDIASGQGMVVSKKEYNLLRDSQLDSSGKLRPKKDPLRTLDFDTQIPWKHTFAGRLSRMGITVACADEEHRAKGDTKQGNAWESLRAKHKYGLSGTIVSNRPRDVLKLDVAIVGDCVPGNPYGYKFPFYDKKQRRYRSTGLAEFERQFVKYAVVQQRGRSVTKELPAVANKEAWWDLHAPLILRRRPDEPDVKRTVEFSTAQVSEIPIKLSKEHLLVYKRWLMHYGEWFLERMKKGEKLSAAEKQKYLHMSGNQLLAQLSKLRLVAMAPGSPKVSSDEVTPEYRWDRSEKTAVHEFILEDVAKMIEEVDYKFIIFSCHPDFLDDMEGWFSNEYGFNVKTFHGKHTIEERMKRLNWFRDEDDAQGLLMSTLTANTGYNIPEGSYVWEADWDWNPAPMEQAWHRILRPGQQVEHPEVKIAVAEGTIQQYMQQWCRIKRESASDLVDREDSFDFNADSWVGLSDFLIAMMKKEQVPGFEQFHVTDRVMRALNSRAPVFANA